MNRKVPSGKVPRVGHLDTLTAILEEMRCIYREARLGMMPLDKATKFVFMLREMRGCLEGMALERVERRLNELEGHHGEPRPDQPAQRPH